MRRKNVVITGASKGIGRALAIRFFEAGFDLAICARNTKELNQFKNELEKKDQDRRILAISCDVSDKEQLEYFAGQVLFEFEEIDVLINNAGVFIPGSLMEEEDGIFEKQIQTNLASAYHLTRYLYSGLRRPGGYIFNMCSTASLVPYINGGSYCISKFALLGFSRVLREESKKEGIRVTSVLPGATYTESWQGTTLPESRFIPAEDIAEAVFQCYSFSNRTVVEELLIRPLEGDL